MNELMGITQDKNVRTLETAAPQKDIEAWRNGEKSATVPSINPMRIDWVGDVRSSWNYDVYLHWAKHMESRFADLPKNIPPPDGNELKEMFFSRLQRLRTIVLASQPQDHEDGSVETEDQIWARLSEVDQVQKKAATATTRRQTVRDHTYRMSPV